MGSVSTKVSLKERSRRWDRGWYDAQKFLLLEWARRENPWAQREAGGKKQEERERHHRAEPPGPGRGRLEGDWDNQRCSRVRDKSWNMGLGWKPKLPSPTAQECSDNKINPQNMKQLQMKLTAWNNSATTKRITFRMLKEIAELDEGECPVKSIQTIEKWKRHISNINGLFKKQLEK